MSATERLRAIQTYDNASDLEAKNEMLAAVPLAHGTFFAGCSHWRPATHRRRHRGAPSCGPENGVRKFGRGSLTTSLWLSSGLVMDNFRRGSGVRNLVSVWAAR